MRTRFRVRALRDPETPDDIDTPYLNDILCNHHERDDLEVLSFTRETLEPGSLRKQAQEMTRFHLRCRSGGDDEYDLYLILKAGMNDGTWRDRVETRLLELGYPRLARQVRLHKSKFHSGVPLEILTYRTLVPHLPIGTPRIYHTVCDEDNERFWIFMEDVSGYLHADGRRELSFWTEEAMRGVVARMAMMHSFFWNDGEFFARHTHLRRWSASWFSSTLAYWREVLHAGMDRCSRFISGTQAEILRKVIRNLVELCTRIDRGPHTVVHGDFSPMNLCFRREGSDHGVVLYDWGSTAIYVPQFDLHYFVHFLLDPERDGDRAARLIDFYLDSLAAPLRRTVDREEFIEVYHLSALRYLCTRELAACILSEETENPWMFRTLRHNLGWAEWAADRYL